jgi:Uma2 family endonuclease
MITGDRCALALTRASRLADRTGPGQRSPGCGPGLAGRASGLELAAQTGWWRCYHDLVSAVRSPLQGATFADLERLGDDVCAEIVRGVIVEKASPTMEHGRAQRTLGGYLGRRFDRKPGGRWPGGWWLGTEVDVEYQEHELYRHDVVGWRRERVPGCPGGRPIRVRPDWVCEVLSPSNEKRDLVDKMRVLREAGVPHYWIVNPAERVLVVHRLVGAGYLVALSASSGETLHAEPFEDVELRVGVLFGDEDEED